MKKNKMMRLASAMMVMTLLTTSVISGTFAKYVTTNSGTDKARVAKWGVEITIADDMEVFKTEYATDDNSEYTGGVSVKSKANTDGSQDNVVAPGTKGSMTFKVTGQPEVAVALKVNIDDTTRNAIQLAAGTYELKAGKFAGKDVKLTTTNTYEPIKFYFGKEPVSASTVYTLTLADLEDKLEALSTTYEPNTDLAEKIGEYTIAWQWAFEGEAPAGTEWVGTEPYADAKKVDFLDTYLGDETGLQIEEFDISITVTQID